MLLAMFVNGFIIYGALKVMRLERWRAGVAASILAMIVAPANLIGLPIGIWALVVLGRREVREAMTAPPRPSGRKVKFAIGAVAALILGVAAWLGLDVFAKGPERCDAPFPVRHMRQQIDAHLHAAQFRWRTTRIELMSDNDGSVWYLSGLKKLAAGGDLNPAASVPGTLRLAPAGPGRWHVRGEKELSGIEFEVAEASNPAAAVVPEESGFSPVVERVIRQDEADEQGFVFFDIETGRSLPPPFALVMRSNQDPAFVELPAALEQWILANRMDVLIHFAGESWSSMNLRMQEDFIPEAAEWDLVTTGKVADVFARWEAVSPARAEVPAASQGRGFHDQFDRPKAFRTRSNTMGVMQWAGQSTTPRSVKICYRLVEATNPKSSRSLTASDRLSYFPADRSFGPEIERVLKIDTQCDFLDFDNGNGFRHSAGSELDLDKTPPLNNFLGWIEERGVDVGFATNNSSGAIELVGFGMGIFPFGKEVVPDRERPTIGTLSRVTNIWNDLDPKLGFIEEFQPILTNKHHALWFSPDLLTHPTLFETREGAIGILQITGFTENPRGVKIRYKLAQTQTGNPAVRQPSPATPRDNPQLERDPGVAIAETIRTKVGRDLTAVGASYDDLEVTIAVKRDSAMPFKVSYRGLRNFKWSDGAAPAANGEFIMEYIGGGQWQGKLGGMQFTVPVGQTDDFTLPFVNDPQVIGEWKSVDFVADPSDFNPDKPNWKGGLYLNGLTFRENGKTANSWETWTKGIVIHRGDKTASHYEIRELKGHLYMFFEWKSGDVMVLGKKPSYYVLKKKL